MLDITTESAIHLNEVARCVPPGRGGKKTHVSTVLRWIQRGARGPGGDRIHLEAVRVGGKWVTTREALQRFIARLTPRHDRDQSNPVDRNKRNSKNASERAGDELDKIGI